MSSPLTYVLIENEIVSCYHSRHAGNTFPEHLIHGPEVVRQLVKANPQIETLDTDADGDVLIDFDRKRLSYWWLLIPWEPDYIPYWNELFAATWPGYSAAFAYRGRSEVAERAGLSVIDKDVPVHFGNADVNSLPVATNAEAALYFGDVFRTENGDVKAIINRFVEGAFEEAKAEKSVRPTGTVTEITARAQDGDFACLDAQELRTLLTSSPNKVVILDLRSTNTAPETERSGTLLIPFLELVERCRELDRDESQVVVCVGDSDSLADAAARFLLENSYGSEMVVSFHHNGLGGTEFFEQLRP